MRQNIGVFRGFAAVARPPERMATAVMELRADDLTCSRGGREVFRGVSFTLPAGEALVVTGRMAPANPRCCAMIAGLVPSFRRPTDARWWRPDVPIAEQAHYLGHQDAMKPSLTVAENVQ